MDAPLSIAAFRRRIAHLLWWTIGFQALVLILMAWRIMEGCWLSGAFCFVVNAAALGLNVHTLRHYYRNQES